MPRVITLQENRLVQTALTMYANWIETKDPLSTMEDLVNQERHKELQALNVEQMQLIINIRNLAKLYATTN
jgi:hypothetical protein